VSNVWLALRTIHVSRKQLLWGSRFLSCFKGREKDIVLTSVNYVHGLWHNLFSITATLKQGYDFTSKGHEVSLRKGEVIPMFDQIVQRISDGSQDGTAFRSRVSLSKETV
jgi:hypothetical protein